MEKVEFIQFEIFNSFNGGERVCQFGGAAADRPKLIRKARRIAKRVANDFAAYKTRSNMTQRDRVSIRAWRGIAFLETRPDGGLVLRGSANYNGSESLPVDYPIKDREEFFRLYCSDCIRSTANYDREFIF